jgi:hypothetical protein
MKRILLVLIASLPLGAEADVTTVFSLGKPYVNYIPALTQDGQPTSGIWSLDYLYDCGLNTCAGGPQANIYLTLPNDPVNPGNRLSVSCTGVITLDARPVISPTQQPPGSLESTETCPFTESWYSGTWAGTVTYTYSSVKQTHCSGGRGGHCVTAYYPVLVGGYGSLTTADPPPPPPPPPPPIVSTIGAGQVFDGLVVAIAIPSQPITSVQFDFVNAVAVLTYADGTTPYASLDYSSINALDDDGELFAYSISGTVYNADFSIRSYYDCELTVTSAGAVTGGTFTEYPQ